MLRYLLLCISCLLLLTACGGGLTGQAKGKKDALPSFLEQGSPKSCPECDLGNADLSGADLTRANLSRANLIGANLDGVIGADFSGAYNVPDKYLKD